MAIVTGDRYLERLVRFVEAQAGPLIDGTLVLKLNPVGLHYVQSRLESLHELERLLAGAPVDYLRAYVSDLGDHRALEQLRRILRLLTSLKVVSVLPPQSRDPTPLSLLPFGRLRFLELRGCDLSTSAARGLLELRHTLEKLICHNSTDALRHVFASRIAEIKDSPQWNRLSFVSCACNGLVLMDESLQLLPAVETLDLSRNKFSKLGNLRKCMKLKHLDLGFNNLRTISSFTEVTSHLVKLVLRNNAITTLHGIENLKSLEGLDVSYNVISNFSELEVLTGLPSLLSLWLEGNPICSARWYRAQVFSLFTYPDKLKLDDTGISKREFWKRQILVAARQKRPASFGFYSPAKDDAEGEGSINRKKKKQSRLASIESEEESIYMCSDYDTVSCDNEVSSREETVRGDDEAGIVDLMNRAELMKRERSVFWLREFKEWIDQSSEILMENGKFDSRNRKWHHGENSRYTSNSFQDSGDGSSTNNLELDRSLAPSHGHRFLDQINGVVNAGGVSLLDMGGTNLTHEHNYHGSKHTKGSHYNKLAANGQQMAANSIIPVPSGDDTIERRSSSSYHGSPPHYQENILQRHDSMVDEILQLSADSYSAASLDTTSCSEDDLTEFGTSLSDVDKRLNGGPQNFKVDGHFLINSFEEKCDDLKNPSPGTDEICESSIDVPAKQPSRILDLDVQYYTGSHHHDGEILESVNEGVKLSEKRKSKRKPMKRVVALSEESRGFDKSGAPSAAGGPTDTSSLEDGQTKQIFRGSDMEEVCEKQAWDAVSTQTNDTATAREKSLTGGTDEFIERYFYMNVATSGSHETCEQYLRCDCVLEQESIYREREVALLRSSERRLYVLLIAFRFDGSGTILSVLGCHIVEDIREVSIGMGFQIVRVRIDTGARYLFITRSIDKSRLLLETLGVINVLDTKCSLKSLEPVQFELFSKQIGGGAKVNIFQYSMILFCHDKIKDKSWASRSLFVTRDQLLICIEDIRLFGTLSRDSSSPPYFSLVSTCSIADVSEMVIESGVSYCVTLVLERAAREFRPSTKAHSKIVATPHGNLSSGILSWKLKWSSETCLFQFVALLKALHAGTGSPLFIRSES
ncbi:hypothetical protein EUGRSUZ_K02277 [Eucalyptus grandis]|uniref:Uncharacterized protein n=2 Tax=Eucalyptus grandis TaxID=71139 RepID=A0ACC3IVX1_EUCGR|nr:hypothetical protein EUGRSUZ_K02277 [Eucalyptus grandis]